MSFSTLGALYWLCLLPLLGLMYLMRPRPRVTPVGTMRFWTEAAPPTRGRIAWGKVRDPLGLAALALVIILLVCSLSGLRLNDENNYRKLVVVLDNSCTMQALDGGETRYLRAQSLARQFVNDVPRGCLVSLVTAARPAQVALGWGDDPAAVVQSINNTTYNDSTRDLKSAVELAGHLLGGDVEGRVVVISDGAEAVRTDSHTSLFSVGKAANNVALTCFQPRRLTSGGGDYELFIEVMNASSVIAECTLEISLESSMVDVIPLKLPAAGSWHRVVTAQSAIGGKLHAELKKISITDALPVDNHAYALLPPPQPLKVALIPSGADMGDGLLRTAIEELPFVAKPIRIITELDSISMNPGEVLICHRRTPKQLPACPVLVIDADSNGEYWKVGASIAESEVRVENPHPATEAVVWPLGALGKPRALLESPASRVVAKATSGEVVLLEQERTSGRVLVLAANLELGSLRYHGSFLVLLGNLLQRLEANESRVSRPLPLGEVVEVDLPPGSKAIMTTPHDRVKQPTSSTHLLVGPLNQAGFWSAQLDEVSGKTIWQGAPSPAGKDHADLQPRFGKSAEATFSSHLPIPIWLICAALVLLAGEWTAYSRGWTG